MHDLCRERINVILIFSVWCLKSCRLDFLFCVGLFWRWEKAMKWERIWHLSVKQQSYSGFLSLIASREYSSLYTPNCTEHFTLKIHGKLLDWKFTISIRHCCTPTPKCWKWFLQKALSSVTLCKNDGDDPHMNHVYYITFKSHLGMRYHSARLYANMDYKINPILMNLQSKSLG